MRAARWIGWLLAGALSTPLTGQLPEWSDEELTALRSGEFVPGSALLAPLTDEEATLDVEAPDWELPDIDLDPVPERFLDAYFGQRPDGYLIDPQGLLASSAREQQEAFLGYHASDSRIDCFVYLFEAEQAIPGEVRHEELAGRFFGEGKPALVICYFLGAPERAEVQLSPSLADAVPEAEQRRLLQGATLTAQASRDPVRQLEQFCVQASIRLYWMEKQAGLGTAAGVGAAAPGLETAVAPTADDRVILSFLEAWGLPVASIAGAAICALGFGLAMRWRARFRFPEFEIAPRLGGAHAAGIGAVVGFGNTTEGPARQRTEVPDSLGGI